MVEKSGKPYQHYVFRFWWFNKCVCFFYPNQSLEKTVEPERIYPILV